MTVLAPLRVGWCPGAFAPMASGDGLMLRLKPRGGRLALAQAQAVALASYRFGNGKLDLTARANLQMRGVSEATLPEVLEALDRVALLDPDPAAEVARNVVSSPLAGFDPSAALDIRPFVTALEARLVNDSSLHGIPAKFGIVVDDGGRLPLSDVPADLRFEAFRDGAGPAFAVRLEGAEAAARCRPEAIGDVAAALIRRLLDARAGDGRIGRMRDLPTALGAEAIFRCIGLGLCSLPARRRSAGTGDFIGHASRSGAMSQDEAPSTILGVAAPFGRMTADQLEALALGAERQGAAELRLTPWRAILVPGLDLPGATALATECALAGFIVDAADPRLGVAACIGAPGCRRATTPVLDHAAQLAGRLEPDRAGSILLHVSGCSKGCAHAGKAPLTLVAHNGRYDVVVGARASDQPVLSGLSLEEAARYLQTSLPTEACA